MTVESLSLVLGVAASILTITASFDSRSRPNQSTPDEAKQMTDFVLQPWHLLVATSASPP